MKRKKNKKLLFTQVIYIINREGLRRVFYKFLIFLIINLVNFKKEFIYTFYGLFFKSIIRKVNCFKMYLDLKDKGICKDLFHDGKREIISTDYMLHSNILKKGDVVLDIGANIGYYVLIESKLVGDNGMVYAVEPVSKNINILKKNIDLNNCKNVEIYNLAIGDTNKKSTIYISDKCNLCAVERKPSKIICEETIDVLTLDTFLKDKCSPNFIRMDVEGYEYNIIKGMSKILENDVKILMEIHGPFLTKKQLEEMFDKLKKYNFKIYFIIVDQKNKESIIVKYLRDKLKDKNNVGFLNMNMEVLLQWLIKEKQYPHVCFSKKTTEDV